MSLSPLIKRLMDDLRCLPGVGPKSAQRMVFHLLERNRDGARRLAHSLLEAVENVGHCSQCRTLSENELCDICSDSRRDPTQICVVESPVDVMAFEQSSAYRGRYFVLMGHLSPLDGIGPNDIGLDILSEQLKSQDIQEVILATNPTVEGEATAHYISDMVQAHNIKTSRIAFGVPLGGELEYIDGETLSRALQGRKAL
jgi:recombination protein RecR